jgi:hypothetical protein
MPAPNETILIVVARSDVLLADLQKSALSENQVMRIPRKSGGSNRETPEVRREPPGGSREPPGGSREKKGASFSNNHYLQQWIFTRKIDTASDMEIS